MYIKPKMRQTKTRIQRWLLLTLSTASLFIFFLIPTQAFAAQVKPHQRACTSGYYYNPRIVNKNYLKLTASPLAVVNNSSSYVDLTKDVTVTGTTSYQLSLALSAGIEANAGIIFTSVKASFSATVTGTISKTYTQTQNFKVAVKNIPPHATRHIEYGRGEIETTGEYYFLRSNCTVQNDGTVTSYFPYEDLFVITN